MFSCDDNGIKNKKYCREDCDYNYGYCGETKCPVHIPGEDIWDSDDTDSHNCDNLCRKYDVLSKKYLDMMIAIESGTSFEIGGKKYLAHLLRNIKSAKRS